MPGNEVGERVHNFFRQSNLSQVQHQTQALEENLWGGDERLSSGAVNSKNYNAQQSGSEIGRSNHFSSGPYGLNFASSVPGPDFARSLFQDQQLILNGFGHGSQVSQTLQNDANGLVMDAESDRHNFIPRGMPFLESQQTKDPQHSSRSSASIGSKESSMNFDFLSGQQQMRGQHPGLLQSPAGQPSGISDTQLVQQQVLLKQVQELQWQQQFQQLEALQRNQISSISPFSNSGGGNLASPFINGTPMNDPSRYQWASQVMAGNTNFAQPRASPSVQACSNGMMISPDQGHQSIRLMGLLPQHSSQSLYGVPVSSAQLGSAPMPSQFDKGGIHHMPIQGNSPFSSNPQSMLFEQGGMQEGKTVSRQGFEAKVSYENSSSQGSGGFINVENFNQIHPRSAPELGGRQDLAVSSSSSLPDRNTKHVGSSEEAVALDPTEEKILFGSDDNIWEAFGESLGGSTISQNQSGGFPSIQSGSWSALMQSAAAESTSNDGVVQGEWNCVGLQHSGSLQGNQQPFAIPDSSMKQTGGVDSSPLGALPIRPLSNDAFLSSNYRNSGFQLPYVSQAEETMQTRSGHQSSDGQKWSDHNQPKLATEGSFSGDYSLKSLSGSWRHQQNMSSLGDRPFNKPENSNFIQPVPIKGSNILKNQGNMQANDFDRVMNVNVGHGGGTPMIGSVPNSNVEMGRQRTNSKDYAMHISSNSIQESDNAHREFWRSGNSAAGPGTDDLRRYQQHLNKGMPQVLGSSSSCGQGTVEMHDARNNNNRENSCDSYGSNVSNRASTSGLRENVSPEASVSYGLSGGKQSSSGLASQKAVPAPRRFQYHPMGDVDMDTDQTYGTQNILQPQGMTNNLYGVWKSQEGQSRVLNPMATTSADTDKGHSSKLQGDMRGSYRVTSTGISSGFKPNVSGPVDSYAGILTPNNSRAASGQNMLELLHKVDQSKELSASGHFCRNEPTKASIPNETAAPGHIGPGPKQLSSSSLSQGFGLQLAPPSEGLRAPSLMMTSQSSSPTVNSPSSSSVASDKGDKTHAWLYSGATDQSLPSVHGTHQGESHTDSLQHSMHMNFPSNFVSDSFHGSMIHNQQKNNSLGNNLHNNSALQRENGPPSRFAQSDAKVLMQQIAMAGSSSLFQASVKPGISQKGNLSSVIPNAWANMMSQQQVLGAQVSSPADLFMNRFQSKDFTRTNASDFQQMQDEKDASRKGDAVNPQEFVVNVEHSASSRQLVTTQRIAVASKGKETSVPMLSDTSLHNSGTAQKDIEAFGRTLKPNSGVVDNCSMLRQAQAIKDMDPDIRLVKRFKGPESSSDDQQMVGRAQPPFSAGLDYSERNSSVSRASSSSVDTKNVISPEPGSGREHEHQLGGDVALPTGLPVQGNLQKFSGGNVYPQISPQMAPTWFKHYGTLKNGQFLPMHDIHRAKLATNVSQQIIIGQGSKALSSDQHTSGQVNAVESGQMINALPLVKSYVSNEQLSSHHPLISSLPTFSGDIQRPKKRKSAAADLLPWHKEVAAVPQKRLHSISLAEEEWAQAAHRLFEKVEVNVALNEDLRPGNRARRRLVLTTQLMQQIIRPPPREILSLDANASYESVTYFVARLALGDACSLVCQSEGSTSTSNGEGNQSKKIEGRGKISDPYLSKVTEDFISKASLLENEFLRLDKRVSFLDLRLECQDLERFAMINRFARFHGRGQVDGAEASDPTSATQKVQPLRYVNAYPSPRNLPERVQCFTL